MILLLFPPLHVRVSFLINLPRSVTCFRRFTSSTGGASAVLSASGRASGSSAWGTGAALFPAFGCVGGDEHGEMNFRMNSLALTWAEINMFGTGLFGLDCIGLHYTAFGGFTRNENNIRCDVDAMFRSSSAESTAL